MKLKFFLKTLSSFKANNFKIPYMISRAGSLYFFPIFLIFLSLATATLILTQIHLKMGSVRTQLVLSRLAAENGLKMAYLFIWERTQDRSKLEIISDSDWQLFIDQFDAKLGLWMLSKILNLEFPLFLQSGWQKMVWKTAVRVRPPKLEDLGNYRLIQFLMEFKAEGKIEPFPLSCFSSMVAEAELGAGYLPLIFFPLLIEKNLTPQEQLNYLEKNRIEVALNNKFFPMIKTFFSPIEIISENVTSFLERGLKIKLFEADKIKPSILRQAIGLEVNSEPVPEGVYLIQDDLGLGGIFVQGDLDRFLLTIEQGYQVLIFEQKNRAWRLSFNPLLNQTIWQTPENQVFFNELPNGIILINGNIHSLEGREDDASHTAEDSFPSIIPGIKLSIITSGHVNITSPIVQGDLEFLPGIPYMQKKQSQIIIFSTGKDLINGEEVEASIIINPGQRDKLAIEANLTALGKGLKIESGGKEIIVKGGIQAKEIDNVSSKLKIIPNFIYSWKNDNPFPSTSRPLCVFLQIKPIEWNEYEKSYN